MRLVKKNRIGQAYEAAGNALSAEDAETIKRYWKGDRSIAGDVSYILHKVHAADLWIACDCRDDDTPILFPRQDANGRYVPVRNPERAAHHEDCVFHWEEGSLGQHGTHLAKPHEWPDLILFRPGREHSSGTRGSRISDVERVKPVDRLQQIFQKLMEEAHLNRMTAKYFGLKEQLEAMRLVARGKPIGLKDFTLDQVLWTHPDWVTKDWAARALHKLREGGWPLNLPLQGYVITLAENIVDRAIYLEGGTVLHIEGKMSRIRLPDGAPVGGPHVVIIGVKMDDKDEKLQLVRAFAQPILEAHNIFPVATAQQRQTAHALRWVLKKVAESNQDLERVEVEKPLYPIEFEEEEEEPVLPDFIVRSYEHSMVVAEMSGVQNEARSAQVERMAKIGPVFEEFRASLTKREADSRIAKKVMGWLKASGAFERAEGVVPTSAGSVAT
ncbi:hypothetical protein [Thiobacillus denitrificans]|uniref:hypothetical protein n=1 Tax=Thiobacillus denitrificans TaxID=36861 RepID=UPI00036455C7|nr:hypothetical protein [Thiobacillus denitrificans]